MASNYFKSIEVTRKVIVQLLETEPAAPAPTRSVAERRRLHAEYMESLQLTLDKLVTAIESLERKLNCWLLAIQGLEGEEKDREQEVYDLMIEDEFGALRIVEDAKARLCGLRRVLSKEDNSSETNGSTLAPVSSSRKLLPQTQLMPFDGQLSDWSQFWGLFESAIHAKKDLSEADKLDYLVPLLRGRALLAIRGYEHRPENYETIVDILKNKFGRVDRIRASLYRELQALPPVTKTRDVTLVVEELECILRQLEALDERVDGTEIEITILDKLPSWLLDDICKEKQKNRQDWSVKRLRDYLQDLAERKEEVQSINWQRQKLWTRADKEKRFLNSSERRVEQLGNPNWSAALAAISTRNEVRPSSSLECYLCQNRHIAAKCDVYKSSEEKFKRAVELRLCLKCLRKNHLAKNCRTRNVICKRCKGAHLTFLCTSAKKEIMNREQLAAMALRKEEVSSSNEGALSKQDSSVCIVNNSAKIVSSNNKEVLMMCKEVIVHNVEDPEKKEKVLLFFDIGSQRSFVDEDLARQLSLKRKKESYSRVATFGSKVPKEFPTHNVVVGIELESGEREVVALSTIDYMTQNLKVVRLDDLNLDEFRSNKELQVKSTWEKPRILIGADYFFKFFESSVPLRSGFNLVKTKVGMMLAGKGSLREEASDEEKFSFATLDVDQFWNLEAIGIVDSPAQKDDEVALAHFQASLARDEEGRYIVGWPWKDKAPSLQSNFGLCLGRLKSLVQRWQGQPKILEEYDKVFAEQLRLGIIEEVPKDRQSAVVTYLPHQPVLTPQKTTKVRIVFDASAKTKAGNSLNDCLYRGPVILPDLVGILLRWRISKIVLLADVEKAFLQVKLHEADREVTRFLWARNLSKPLEGQNLLVYRYTRVLFGVVSSPFLLAAVIRHHLNSSRSLLASKILQNLYVDNVMLVGNDLDEAMKWYLETKNIFKEALMNVREFVSNVPELQKTILGKDRSSGRIKSVLGLNWDLGEDIISLKTKEWSSKKVTKRAVVKFMQEHFDPLGLVAPIILPLKLFCQSLWQNKFKWDQEVSIELEKEWNKLLSGWDVVEYKIPRLVVEEGIDELHLFVDASKLAYCAVIYACNRKQQQIKTALLFAKVRVTPIKGLTIPRAELLAALIGGRALRFLKKQLNLENVATFAWSDSKCVILWLKDNNPTSLPKFVSNRIIEIKESKIQFAYVPTEFNPADIGTRGLKPRDFLNCQMWWQGPLWLTEDKKFWPKIEVEKEPQEILLEWAKGHTVQLRDEVNNLVVDELLETIDFVRANRFKSWKKLLGTMIKVVLFLKRIEKRSLNCLIKLRDGSDNYEANVVARLMLIKQAQSEIKTSDVAKWNLVKDEQGIWRVHGRIGLHLPSARLIYLPRDNEITKLLVLDAHDRCLHSGVAHTLTKFRENYWVERGRRLVRHILTHDCFRCRRFNAKPFQLPTMPSLPKERVNEARVFQHTGVDLAGPFIVKTIENKNFKKWVLLFTCLVTRAVHLECVGSQNAVDFLHAYKRFTARRGCPETILSDNASQFVIAKQFIDVEWRFITAQAPWKGGVYERLIGLFKNALHKAIGKSVLTDADFENLVIRIESVLNTRPITQVTDETSEVLRPIDFLQPHVRMVTEHADEQQKYNFKQKSTSKELQKRFAQLELTLRKFWVSWRDLYMNSLRERNQKIHKQGKFLNRKTPKVGEIVIMKDDDTYCGKWKLARIISLVKSSDGQVRSATIVLGNGIEAQRPISHLFSLELNEEVDNVDENVAQEV